MGGAQGSLPETQRRAKHRLSAAFRNPGGVSAVQTMLKGSCPVRSGTGAPSSFPPPASVLNAPRLLGGGSRRFPARRLSSGKAFCSGKRSLRRGTAWLRAVRAVPAAAHLLRVTPTLPVLREF